MATQPINSLKQVATYAEASLGYLVNQTCFIPTLNTKFLNFQDRPANLGSTIMLQLPTRSVAGNGLVASFQPVTQREVPLTCDQAAHSAMAFNNQDFVFSAEKFMKDFNMARVEELANKIEINVARNCDSSVPVMTIDDNGQSVPTGALHTESGPYRFYDAISTGLTSFQQLARMAAKFRNYGAASGDLKVYLDDMSPVDIVGTGQNAFVPSRNDKLSNSWDLGTYSGSRAKYYSSNQLPLHTSGTLGNDGVELTVVSTNDPTGANITQITCSNAGTDSGAILSGDLGYLVDGVSGFENMRYLTFIGHSPSKNPVEFRVTANAASSADSVTFNITPALQSTSGPNQNINQNVQAGMKIKFLPSHRAGMVVGGNAFYLAMPRLPDEAPNPTGIATSKDIGVSMRVYHGSRFGLNFRGIINDAIWATLAVPEYTMRVCLPV